MKTGLVLEGGGMRGLFSEGVFDVLLENNIYLDGLVGVSAGVLFGCNYKSHQIGRGIRYNLKYKDDPRYMSWRSWLRTGNYLAPDFAFRDLPFRLDLFDSKTFRDEPMEFYVGCTDIVKGEPVYKRIVECDENALDWMRASGSMPLMATPMEIEGHTMLDGGIADSIPLRFFQEHGYKHNIVILTQPHGYRKKPFGAMWVFRMFMRKYPKVAEMMARRHTMYNDEVDYVFAEGEKGDTLVICPDEPLNIGRVESDGSKMQRCYDMGRRKGLEMLDEIRRFCDK